MNDVLLHNTYNTRTRTFDPRCFGRSSYFVDILFGNANALLLLTRNAVEIAAARSVSRRVDSMLHFISFKAVTISLARLLLLLITGDRVIPVKATMVKKRPARAMVAMRWITVMMSNREQKGIPLDDVSSNDL